MCQEDQQVKGNQEDRQEDHKKGPQESRCQDLKEEVIMII